MLDEAVKKAKELGSDNDELAAIVSVGALKWNDLKRDAKTEIVFDWNEILNMQGNSGPYLQYTFARTQSVIKKSGFKPSQKIDQAVVKSKLSDQERLLLSAFIHFPEIVEEAAQKYAPNLLCNYLYDLASKFNTFYNGHKIIGGENEQLKLAIVYTTGKLINKGLTLLGIESPEKM